MITRQPRIAGILPAGRRQDCVPWPASPPIVAPSHGAGGGSFLGLSPTGHTTCLSADTVAARGRSPGSIEGASRFLSDLNALHPFREGNGRTQRAFLRLLSTDAGWHVAWSEVDPAGNAAISADAMADPRAFVPLFDRILHPLA
jgi:Fic/DOC family protein